MTSRLGLAFGMASCLGLGACSSGIAARPVNDAASHISDTAAAGKAAHAKCVAEKTSCDEVNMAFDLIGKDAEGLKKLSGGASP
jgi:hypothetical protein